MDRKDGYPHIPSGAPTTNKTILDSLVLVNAPIQLHGLTNNTGLSPRDRLVIWE